MIRIVDYGIGNIQAFLNLFDRLGIVAKRAQNPDQLCDASHLILPGVGHFDHAMKCFNESGLSSRLEELVLGEKVPLMGVCVGMHMLAFGSDEGTVPGLGWIPGRVRSLADNPLTTSLPMPHMGWNQLQLRDSSRIFPEDQKESPQFYFLHSYYFDTEDKSDVIATAHYGFDFDAVVSHSHIFGVQCHPEKSHRWGQQLLNNFAEY